MITVCPNRDMSSSQAPSGRSGGVRLFLGRGVAEFRAGARGRFSAQEGGIGVERAIESPRIGQLRRQADVRTSQRFAEIERSGLAAQHHLQRGRPFADPMGIPTIPCRIRFAAGPAVGSASEGKAGRFIASRPRSPRPAAAAPAVLNHLSLKHGFVLYQSKPLRCVIAGQKRQPAGCLGGLQSRQREAASGRLGAGRLHRAMTVKFCKGGFTAKKNCYRCSWSECARAESGGAGAFDGGVTILR